MEMQDVIERLREEAEQLADEAMDLSDMSDYDAAEKAWLQKAKLSEAAGVLEERAE